MPWTRTRCIAAVSLIVFGWCSAVAGQQPDTTDEESRKPPNILFADDQRPDTIGAWGNPDIDTPNLDGLVADGFSLRGTYVFGANRNAVCLPSRAMLLGGKTWLETNRPDFE